MRIISISGTQDSGKTSVIKELIASLSAKGKRSAVIVNEESIEHLRGGWLGCTLATSLVQLKKKLKKAIDPDFLFLEPSEMIVTRELRDVVKMGLRDIQYDIGPFITLIDGPTFSFQWQERPKLLLGQIHHADRVAISRVDSIDKSQIASISEILNFKIHDLLLLSMQNSSSLDELLQQILSMDQVGWSLA